MPAFSAVIAVAAVLGAVPVLSILSTYDFRVPVDPKHALLLLTWYLSGLYASLFAYRLWFHPLRKFPGPPLAKLSNLWWSTQLASRLDGHLQIQALHAQHGPFVRIGSSDLSIAHPAGVAAVYGPRSLCTKGAFYENTHPMVSLQTTRDHGLHRERRRIWSEAFSDKAMRGYEKRISVHRARLLAAIAARADRGEFVDVEKWFAYFNFDIMGDLAFSAGFNMLGSEENHWILAVLQDGLKPMGLQLPVWLLYLGFSIPGLAKDWHRFVAYCCHQLDERLGADVKSSDIMETLLRPWRKTPTIPQHGRKLLEGDSQLIIVAGSDTTAATLTHVLYELVKKPACMSLLVEELRPHVKDGQVHYPDIQALPYLNGVINEALRLHPPVPTALPRITPPEGLEIGGVHVPGNMTVWCPQYAIGRSEDIYSYADDFIPERWFSKPELIKEKDAFAPFSTGAYGCIGKSLALQNLRITLAEILTQFTVEPGHAKDLALFEKETTDHFTLGLPSLQLAFHKIKR